MYFNISVLIFDVVLRYCSHGAISSKFYMKISPMLAAISKYFALVIKSSNIYQTARYVCASVWVSPLNLPRFSFLSERMVPVFQFSSNNTSVLAVIWCESFPSSRYPQPLPTTSYNTVRNSLLFSRALVLDSSCSFNFPSRGHQVCLNPRSSCTMEEEYFGL